MNRTLIALVSVGILTGCAPTQYVRSSEVDTAAQAQLYQCQQEANAAIHPAIPYSSGRRAEMVKQCMSAHGFVPKQ